MGASRTNVVGRSGAVGNTSARRGAPTAGRPRAAAVRRLTVSPWVRLWAFALGVLALLMLLSAPAARGVAPGPGDRLWVNWLDGADHTLDAIVDVAEAPDGTLWAAGVTNDDWGAGADLLIVKQSPSAGAGWTLAWDAGQDRADRFADLEVDAAGNAIVVGNSTLLPTMDDWTVAKFSPDRVLLWAKHFGSAMTGADWATDAVCDPAGNVYVCGSCDAGAQGDDWQVVKFRAGSGSRAWTYTYSAPAATHSGDAPTAITLGEDGDLYVAGHSRNKAGGMDAVVAKLETTGKPLWVRRIDGPSHLWDQGAAIAPAPSGGAYVAVESWTGDTRSSLLLARFTASGGLTWPSKWRTWSDGVVAGLTSVEGVQLDAAGNVYVAGTSWQGGAARGFVQKRSASGALRWVRYYRPAGVERSDFYDFAVSSAGRVWVAGSLVPTGGTQDWLLVRYETDGSRRWVSTFDTPADHLADWVNAITLCGTKSLFAGGVMGTSTNDDAGTAKYLR